MENNWSKPVERFCGNCGQHLYGYTNSNGCAKFICPHCGMVTVSKKISRRKASVDEFAPPGQELKM